MLGGEREVELVMIIDRFEKLVIRFWFRDRV